MRKIAAAILLSSVVLTLVPMASMAENITSQQDNQITPRWSCIVEAESDFIIDGNTATVDCWVKGNYGSATKAKVIAELQVKSGNNWIPVAIWTDTQNGYEASVYEEKAVTTGHTYRVKGTFTVWEGSQSEEVILFTNERTA